MAAQTHIPETYLPTEPEQTSHSVHTWLESPDYQTSHQSSAQTSSSSLTIPNLNRPRAYSATPSTQPQTDAMSPSSRSSNRSSISLSQESYASGKFAGRGVFKPAGNAQYNFIVQRFKHRKEDKAQKAEQRPQLTAKNLKKLG